MNSLKRKRRRILLLFAFGVGAPSLLLGYLAFRGIRNDQALLEKRNRGELRLIAGQVASAVEKSISKVEEDFTRLAESRDNSLNPDSRELLKFKKRYPLVEDVFLLHRDRAVHYPAAALLYVPDGAMKTAERPQESAAARETFLAGQQAEFRARDFKRAAILYRQSRGQARSLQMRGEVLNALARVQKKDGLFRDAVDTYKLIAQDFGQVRGLSGIPLGLAAGFEIVALDLDLEDRGAAFQAALDLYKELTGGKWALEKAQYDFFSLKAVQALETILSSRESNGEWAAYKTDVQVLKNREVSERRKTERLLVFQAEAPSELRRMASQDSGESRAGGKRAALNAAGRSYLVSLLGPRRENGDRENVLWGLLIDREFLKADILAKAFQRYVPPEGTGWAVKGPDGERLMSSGAVPADSLELQADFSGGFPDWRIELRRQDPHLFESFLTSGRGLYFFAFLLIGGILIFGLVLTVRSVTQELELSRMKSDFISTVSHEFKSPLTSIRHLAEMLQSGRVPSEDRRRKYYDVLVEQSERLTRLTENVLDFARMEEGRKEFRFEPVNVAALLEDAVSAARERVGHEGFEIGFRADRFLPLLEADGAALSQAVDNLLDNAVKYSAGKKKITVSAEARGRHVVVSVRDFGLGIKKEEQDKVFERFYRGGEELTRTVKGSGLGLTLVKKIVEAHKGSVRLESELGMGSTFSLWLPVNRPKEGNHGKDPDHRG